MRFTRIDFLKFSFYTILFFSLFLGYTIVSGPFYETTFDSASIMNQEIPVSSISEQSTIIPKNNVPKKNIQSNSITIAFNPEYVKIDNDIVNRLKKVIRSSYFGSKVTPLNLVLDSERQEPR